MKKTSQIIKLSASSVKTYEQCPKKYYFNYIERAPKKHWDHFDLGNLCHRALEEFHEEYMLNGTSKYKSLGKLMSHSFKNAAKEYPNASTEILKNAKSMLSDYLVSVKKSGMPLVKGVEADFNIKLADNIILRGFVDRLDIMDDGTYRIVDYKTTKNPKYLDEFQLLIYGIWLNRKYENIDSFKAAYILLKHNSRFMNFDLNKTDIINAEKKLLKFADSIRNENEWITIPTPLCNWCDFKDICPAMKMANTW